ncbi:MFS transporter (plasmid) [Halorussus limi]|uniref:MFS transporter n=1 Tax=Halorussus limi TaxID=2938695 RepID=A0A8U0HZW4_9EURY|nr:MFS transporter [Halorussus limi]UPV76682.1 MFS transporter [Halorussus limi]
MKLFEYVARRDWPRVVGYLLFVSLLSAGYYYNLTFVQLGLFDLGVNRVGMDHVDVSIGMALLALLAFLTAVVTGVWLDRTGWSRSLLVKLRLVLGVVLVQFVLTATAPLVATSEQFFSWVVVCAISLGVGMPTTLSLTIDFIPVRDRGYVAAAIAAISFSIAAIYPLEWSIEGFSLVMVAAMIPGIVVLGVLASGRVSVVEKFAGRSESFDVGRFCRPNPVSTWSLTFWTLVVLMFGVFFIDSLGFLRIVETPTYIFTSWQSPSLDVRLFIALAHVVGAGMAGVLYTNFERRWLFLWVFGLFSFTHLLYTFDIRMAQAGEPSLLLPLFYVLAVSFYTTLNFALWPDLSTPETIGTHSAIGLGMAGFLATFLSTGVALYFQAREVSLFDHLNFVNALALLLFFSVAVLLYVRRMIALARGEVA